jgi:hypothetical protein
MMPSVKFKGGVMKKAAKGALQTLPTRQITLLKRVAFPRGA